MLTAGRTEARRLAASAAMLAVLGAASVAVVDAWAAQELLDAASAAGRAQPGAGDRDRATLAYLLAHEAPGREQAAIQEALGAARLGSGDAQGALRAFGRSLEMRPVSAVTWADVAESQYLSGAVDATFAAAVRNAAALGPQEPEVQRVVAFNALAVWDELDTATRAAADRLIGAEVRRDAVEALRIAERRGRLGPVCEHLRGARSVPENLLRHCQEGGGAT